MSPTHGPTNPNRTAPRRRRRRSPMKVGILQTGHAHPEIQARHGPVDRWFHRLLDDLGFAFETWPVLEGVFPDSPLSADGWLVTGSEHGAYDALAWIAPLEDFIREVAGLEHPLVGICFGHQIIAQALGGRVEKFEGGWAVGQQRYRMGDASLVLNAWHQDQVVARPPCARRVATSDFCDNAILAYDGNILTVQAHPEFSEAHLADMIRFRGASVPEGVLADARTRNGRRNDNAMLRELLATTLKAAPSPPRSRGRLDP